MSNHDDIINDPEFREWAEEVERDLVPKIAGSAATVSLVPNGPTDVKFAIELGMSIMLDKPIILILDPGQAIPAALRRVADEIVEVDWRKDPRAGNDAIQASLSRLEEKGLIHE